MALPRHHAGKGQCVLPTRPGAPTGTDFWIGPSAAIVAEALHLGAGGSRSRCAEAIWQLAGPFAVAGPSTADRRQVP